MRRKHLGAMCKDVSGLEMDVVAVMAGITVGEWHLTPFLSKAKGYLADFTFCETCRNNLYGTSQVRIKERPRKSTRLKLCIFCKHPPQLSPAFLYFVLQMFESLYSFLVNRSRINPSLFLRFTNLLREVRLYRVIRTHIRVDSVNRRFEHPSAQFVSSIIFRIPISASKFPNFKKY